MVKTVEQFLPGQRVGRQTDTIGPSKRRFIRLCGEYRSQV